MSDSNKSIEAAIDIGSNTILFLVAEIESQENRRNIIKIISDEREIPRLGRGVHATHKFSEESMLLARLAFEKYRKLCDELGVQKVYAVATSAARDATNSKQFFEKIKNRFDFDIQIIDGKDEAQLSFIGGLGEGHDSKTHALIDIGGGSTEFVHLQESEVMGQSVDIGCVRATELFLKADPYAKVSIDDLMRHLKNRWTEIDHKLQQSLTEKKWVAIAGTPTALAALEQNLVIFEADKVDGFVLTLEMIKRQFDVLCHQTQEVREANPIMGPGRADVMVAGAGILITAMEFFKKESVLVSTRGLRHGLLKKPIRRL